MRLFDFFQKLENDLEQIANRDTEKLIEWINFVDDPQKAFQGLVGFPHFRIVRKIAKARGMSEYRILDDALRLSSRGVEEYQLFRQSLKKALS